MRRTLRALTQAIAVAGCLATALHGQAQAVGFAVIQRYALPSI